MNTKLSDPFLMPELAECVEKLNQAALTLDSPIIDMACGHIESYITRLTADINTPLYEHDCDKCEFVGHIDNMDLYICPQIKSLRHDIIARFGDDGPDYYSYDNDTLYQRIRNATTEGSPVRPHHALMLYAYSLWLNHSSLQEAM